MMRDGVVGDSVGEEMLDWLWYVACNSVCLITELRSYSPRQLEIRW